MFEVYVKVVGITNVLLCLLFFTSLVVQYVALLKKRIERSYFCFRLQTMFMILFHILSFSVLMNVYGFSKDIVLIYLGELGLIIITSFVIDHFFSKTLLPLWSISQFFLVISFVILARLSIELGVRQLFLATLSYAVVFLVAFIYSKVKFLQYLGIPCIIIAFALLLMTNATIGGATNWLKIGNFSFQPSEIVKILYIIFLASVFTQFAKYDNKMLMMTGLLTSGLVFVQVFQKDLGSALIFYVVFILMTYVYTTNRFYIITGFVVTMLGGLLAYYKFAHVRVRIEAWIDPWTDIDNQGYQITQSLFAIGNGGLFGTGLSLGHPDKIPVVTTDFIYSAIFEEMGMIVGIMMIFMAMFFLLFGILMIKKSKLDFDFLLGSGLLIILAFQSFLIIGGVTKFVPLTGVTLPFVSYGGSSLVTSFIMLGLLQGICLNQLDDKKKGKGKKKREKRNKPLGRIRIMFAVMFIALSGYIIYYTLFLAPDMVMNDYNSRLTDIENSIVRGTIYDRNMEVLATSQVDGDDVVRIYPYGNTFAHTIGYVDYGRTGIEAYSHIDLIKTNSTLSERILAKVTNEKLQANSVVTTLDFELQLLARDLLGDNRGAIVAIEPSSGKILSMVSTPDFDPNNIENLYEGISKDADKAALLNRATQGLYPPASTYKIITTIAYLENNNEDDFSHYCLGEDIIGDKRIHCYNSVVHGRLSLDDAFAKSCNTAYAGIGQNLDADRLKEISEVFMYNKPIALELETSPSQFVLNSQSSKPEITETSIGQGKTLVTPLNSALIVSAIANDGIAMNPYLVDKILDDDGSILQTTLIGEGIPMITPDMANLLESYMLKTSKEGTAKSLYNDHYLIASKTGSAENGTGDAHAWYVGYAPADNPKIAIAVVVENVGSSSANAVPIAKELFDAYLLNKAVD